MRSVNEMASGREASGDAGRRHLEQVAGVSDEFFRNHADPVSRACRDMAARFFRGGRILAFGSGAWETDAYHVAVEFVHPVLVGRRALPALALEGDAQRRLQLLGRRTDIALGFWEGEGHEGTLRALQWAGDLGLLTVGFTGAGGGALAPPGLDHLFVVPAEDPTVVQEVHETLYHVLWELVHVFLDRPGLLEREGSDGRAAPGSGPHEEDPAGCAVCGDEGEVGTVLEITADPRIARVRLPSGDREVAVDFLDEVRPGDRIVVQLGFAIGALEGSCEPGEGT